MTNLQRKHRNYVEQAIQLAQKSTMIKQHGSVLVKDGEIIGKGYNYRVDNLKCTYSIHAEIDAILDAKKTCKNDFRNSTLYVVRINNKNDLSQSLPCEKCNQFINRHKIPKVYFSCKII